MTPATKVHVQLLTNIPMWFGGAVNNQSPGIPALQWRDLVLVPERDQSRSVLKSALQKAVRRGKREEAVSVRVSCH